MCWLLVDHTTHKFRIVKRFINIKWILFADQISNNNISTLVEWIRLLIILLSYSTLHRYIFCSSCRLHFWNIHLSIAALVFYKVDIKIPYNIKYKTYIRTIYNTNDFFPSEENGIILLTNWWQLFLEVTIITV